MSDTTPNLRLPYILPQQAQKHVTHNEAIRALDALVQISVASRTTTEPPASPTEGARYIVPAGATGAWSGAATRIAALQDGAWTLFTPLEGWLVWVQDEDQIYAFDGQAWGKAGGSVNPAPFVGVNATADATNRLAVNAAASLFNHDGTDHRQKINKATAANTASTIFQTGFSARAEMGLTGDDNFHVKVSPDGTSWKEALVVDRATGAVSFPLTTLGAGFANPWAGKKWAALGTSITAGGLYVSPLATLLGVTVVNQGVSGGCIAVNANGGGSLAIYNQVASIAADADLVTIEPGMNDFGFFSTLGTIADTTTATFYGALHAAGVAVLAANTKRTLVFIITYNNASTNYPGGANWNTPNSNGNTIAQFQQAIRDVARKLGCPVIDISESGISAQTAALYMSDGLHINGVGGQRYAQFCYDRLLFVKPPVLQVAQPAFSLAAGTYTPPRTLTITCATAGAAIYVTTDGTTPTVASALYTGPIALPNGTTTVKAIAVKSGMLDSAITTAAYTVQDQVATPTFSPAGGTYATTQTVTIACATAGATIYYTTDGSAPTTASPVYSGPITVAANTTINALAAKAGMANSAVATAAYTISSTVATPTFSPAASTYSSAQSVTIACGTPGASIYYTTDGSAPTTTSQVYSMPLSIAATTTLKALAAKAGMTNSAIATATYTISAGFTPASLSPAMWYDASDLSTLFQDTAGTMPVTADGQAVARINDKSGNGRHLTQATASKRPLYKTDGTKSWLLFDGVDDELMAAATYTTPSGSWALCWATKQANPTANNHCVVFGSNGSPNNYSTDAFLYGQPCILASGSGVTDRGGSFATASAGNDHTNIFNVAAGTMTIYQDGVASSGGTYSGYTTFATYGFGHAYGNPTYTYGGRIYQGLVVPAALSAQNITDLTTWLKAKAGVP